MPTTFNVIYLGVQTLIDPTEGNTVAENASALVGQTFGSAGAPLHQNIQTLSPGSTGFSGGTSDAYDQDNTVSNDTFTIDGGPEQTFDAVAAYNITITYSDGTTASVVGGLLQDTAGNTYVAPLSGANQDALEAKAIESITVNSIAGDDYAGLNADREIGNYVTPDGTIDGTAGDDVIGSDYGEADGDMIDGFDGDDDLVDGGAATIVSKGARDPTPSMAARGPTSLSDTMQTRSAQATFLFSAMTDPMTRSLVVRATTRWRAGAARMSWTAAATMTCFMAAMATTP